MSLHIGDYRKDTGHLRAAEHGAYLLLIMHYWAKGGLPDDDRQLSAIACMSDREWKRARPLIEPLFKDGRWRHKRIDIELAAAQEKYEKHSAAGKKGGRPKKPPESQAFSEQKPPERDDEANQKQPITDNREKKELRANARRARAKAPLPDNFWPKNEVALGLGWSNDKIFHEFQRFKASALAHNRLYANWQAAWDNWCRSPFQQQNQQGNGHERGGKSLLAAIDRIAETLEGATDCEAGENPILGLPPR